MSNLPLWRRRLEDGAVTTLWLAEVDGALVLRDEETGVDLPLIVPAILATFERYARPLAAAPPPPGDPIVELALTGGQRGRLRGFRFRAYGDVEPNDYLLLERDDAEPLAAPAPLLSAALLHLARAAAGSRL